MTPFPAAAAAAAAGARRSEDAGPLSASQLRHLLDSAAEGIYAIDTHGCCTFCNAACVRLLGYTDAAQLVGAPMHAIMHFAREDGSSYPIESCPIHGPLSDGVGRHSDGDVFWRADGSTFPVEYWSYPLSESGVITGAVVTFLDITQRRAALEVVTTLGRAVEHSADSIVVTDRHAVIEYVNPAYEAMSGYTRDELVGATPRIVKSGVHDRQFYARLWNTLLSGCVYTGVLTNRAKDGHLFEEDQVITPVRDAEGTITHFVACGRDITHRRRTQEALRRLHAQLENEATRIAGVLHDEAGQFLTSAHITLADISRDVPPDIRERLQGVRRQLDQVEEQLRGLSHELRPRILDDLGLLGAIRFIAQAFARRTGIEAVVHADSFPTDAYCEGVVATALYRLVQEGLTNLGKHAHATAVSIVLIHEPNAVCCSIRDNGRGFDVATVLARRGDSGLGLRGIRDRLLAVGGTFDIISALGQGTELTTRIQLEA
jgi:PAS domain S-box-containing protein